MKKLKQKLREINIKDIVLDKANPRVNKTIDVKKLATNIKEVGLLNPIMVKPFRNKYKLIDGERRFRAIKLLKQNTINCIVLDNNDDNLFRQVSICLNSKNLPTFPDKARAIYNLFKKTGMNSSQLGKKLGIDASYLRKLRKFWLSLGYGVDEGKLIQFEVLTARIVSRFEYLTIEERLQLASEIKDLKKKKLLPVSFITNLIPYFQYIKKEDQENILKYGFMTAVEWTKEIKRERDKIKYTGMYYNKLRTTLSNTITHLEWLLENIKSNTNLKDYQVNTLKFMLTSLFFKLEKMIEKE